MVRTREQIATKGQKDEGTEGQGDRGTEGRRDEETKVRRDEEAEIELNPNGTPGKWITIRVPIGVCRSAGDPLGRVDAHLVGPQAAALKRVKAAICWTPNASDVEVIKYLLSKIAEQLEGANGAG